MSEKKEKPEFHLSQDCIDSGKAALEKDPDGRVVWIHNHAYLIPSEAGEDDDAVNLRLKLNIAGIEFPVRIPFPPHKVGDLRKKIEEGEAMDITNLLKRPKK